MTIQYFVKKLNAKPNEVEKQKWIRYSVGQFFLNTELIAFISNFLDTIPNIEQKIDLLFFIRKVVKQDSRLPQGEYFEAFKEEFTEMIYKHSEAQKEHNPIAWINSELEYLMHIKQSSEKQNVNTIEIKSTSTPIQLQHSGNKLLNLKQILKFLGISKSTLGRWRNNGLPVARQGKKLYANPIELQEWIDSKKFRPNYG